MDACRCLSHFMYSNQNTAGVRSKIAQMLVSMFLLCMFAVLKVSAWSNHGKVFFPSKAISLGSLNHAKYSPRLLIYRQGFQSLYLRVILKRFGLKRRTYQKSLFVTLD